MLSAHHRRTLSRWRWRLWSPRAPQQLPCAVRPRCELQLCSSVARPWPFSPSLHKHLLSPSCVLGATWGRPSLSREALPALEPVEELWGHLSLSPVPHCPGERRTGRSLGVLVTWSSSWTIFVTEESPVHLYPQGTPESPWHIGRMPLSFGLRKKEKVRLLCVF